ncbi:hypothetical protein [Lysobacter xanthus]
MDWIDRLDEEGWNVVIDELVWHLSEGRSPVVVRKVLSPLTGVEFSFELAPPAFFPVRKNLFEEHWASAVEIASRFPELVHVQFQAEA